MRKLMLATVLLTSCFAFGQKKTAKKQSVPPIVKPAPIETPKIEQPISYDDEEKCFIYTKDEKKDNLVYNTEKLLKYGWASNNARIIITSYNYDPVEKQKAESSGDILGYPIKTQYIDGKYRIEKNTVFFTPDKTDKSDNQNFQLIYQSKKLHHAIDNQNNILTKIKCPEQSISPTY